MDKVDEYWASKFLGAYLLLMLLWKASNHPNPKKNEKQPQKVIRADTLTLETGMEYSTLWPIPRLLHTYNLPEVRPERRVTTVSSLKITSNQFLFTLARAHATLLAFCSQVMVSGVVL